MNRPRSAPAYARETYRAGHRSRWYLARTHRARLRLPASRESPSLRAPLRFAAFPSFVFVCRPSAAGRTRCGTSWFRSVSDNPIQNFSKLGPWLARLFNVALQKVPQGRPGNNELLAHADVANPLLV